ncbi:sigma-70 family RNA polymerase sigma factor [Streptomyces sp. GC420]|uniref:sigma-70 family RNA polymerase sigma factor n=1 Tax=Streptomyces sp. GC420 TaxID=2697568 RepID=UPI001414DBAD|nr:sigma-70 family RNA polymerase sigma factor [Streptomyces sp. GC420]NBM18495.1 sigma-70 family RNA polymerase sigma factor [Streptomyces sp. GC420]
MRTEPRTSATAPPHGDQDFARDIYRLHGKALLRFARSLVMGDTHLAEDIVQEAVLRAWRHSDRLRGTPGLTRPWLFTVVRRLAIDTHRTRRTRPTECHVSAMESHVVPDSGERTLTALVLKGALATLAPAHREIIVHRFLLDLSVKETAAELDIPAGTVKSRSSKALRSLSRALASDRFAAAPPGPPDDHRSTGRAPMAARAAEAVGVAEEARTAKTARG